MPVFLKLLVHFHIKMQMFMVMEIAISIMYFHRTPFIFHYIDSAALAVYHLDTCNPLLFAEMTGVPWP